MSADGPDGDEPAECGRCGTVAGVMGVTPVGRFKRERVAEAFESVDAEGSEHVSLCDGCHAMLGEYERKQTPMWKVEDTLSAAVGAAQSGDRLMCRHYVEEALEQLEGDG